MNAHEKRCDRVLEEIKRLEKEYDWCIFKQDVVGAKQILTSIQRLERAEEQREIDTCWQEWKT